jgi:hypothetical protein
MKRGSPWNLMFTVSSNLAYAMAPILSCPLVPPGVPTIDAIFEKLFDMLFVGHWVPRSAEHRRPTGLP